MIKRLLAAMAIALAGALTVPAVASAHVLKVDGDIGAVLHINPDDNPVAGDATDYIMSFDDDTDRFSLPKCDCRVSIIEHDKTVATEPLVVSSDEVSENHYTFLKPDVYTLRFSGRPKIAAAFQPFTLDYQVRVTGGQASRQAFPLLLWIGFGLAIGLILLAAYTME